MLGKFLDTGAVDDFARWVVAELQRDLPPGKVDAASNKLAARRQQLDTRLRVRAERLRVDAHPNVYQKAMLGIRLQEFLKAAGYSPDFARPFAVDVVKLVASTPR